jgi:hypothetical protein
MKGINMSDGNEEAGAQPCIPAATGSNIGRDAWEPE